MQVPEFPTETIIAYSTVPLKFGFGAADETGYEAKRLDARKVLICTDRNIRDTGHPERIKKMIEKEGIAVEIYDDVQVEPTDDSFNKGAGDIEGSDYDLYVAIGGGSTIDTTKAINLLNTYPASILEYVNKPIGNARTVPGPLKPLLVLPTTAGTGSESTPSAIMDILDLKVKSGISHPRLRPTMALIDPLLTVSMPPEVTASTGMDVLTHALESYTSMPYDQRLKPDHPAQRASYCGSNFISDIFCVKAIEFTGKYLRRAVANRYDLEARWHMMAGSTLAGIGFGNSGVHIPHSMAYPIGGMACDYLPAGYNIDEPIIPHGQAVSVTAPAAFRYTAPIWPEKHAHAAELLRPNITKGKSLIDAALAISGGILQLMKDIGFPNGLNQFGYSEADIPQLIDGTLKQQRLLIGSPLRVGERELSQIAKESMRLW
ncbi:MAG: hydroxyacid-oxoacid transhydrogenase [Desulfobacterales bacterium]